MFSCGLAISVAWHDWRDCASPRPLDKYLPLDLHLLHNHHNRNFEHATLLDSLSHPSDCGVGSDEISSFHSSYLHIKSSQLADYCAGHSSCNRMP